MKKSNSDKHSGRKIERKVERKVERKIGRFNLEEENFIFENHAVLSLDDIAKRLNRQPRAIRDFILRNDLSQPQDYRLRHKLFTRSYWKEVKAQLLEHEIEKFIVTWTKIMEQFSEDFQHSEELQLKQFILCEILIDRAIRSQTEAIKKITELEQKILEEQKKSPPNIDIINLHLSFIQQYNAISQQASKERLELAKESQKLFDAIKGSRAQRVTKISDANKTFSSALQILEDPEMRELIGKDIQLLHMAQLQATRKLYEYFIYLDGKVDNPILSHETYEYLEKTGKLREEEDEEEDEDKKENKQEKLDEMRRAISGRDPAKYKYNRDKNRYQKVKRTLPN